MPKISGYQVFIDHDTPSDTQVITDRGILHVNLIDIPSSVDRRTGRCYELAGVFQQNNEAWTVVHAITRPPVGPWAGKDFDHAFAERDGVVFDPVFAEFFPLEEFYAIYGVTDARKYDSKTAARLLLKENLWGPWR